MVAVFAMFPGQGSQSVGMGKNLAEEFKSAKLVFEEASDALSLDMKRLCWEGPESELKMTEFQQPAILCSSYAFWQVLRTETGFSPSIAAGHSLGEYSALVCSGRLGFADGLRIVKKRGQSMQNAVPNGKGSMAAVMKADYSAIEEICAAERKDDHVVEIANHNSPSQVIISGHTEAVTKASQELEKLGAWVKPLPVSAPFHCRLMQPAAEVMEPVLSEVEWQESSISIIANRNAKLTKEYSSDLLIEQITHPVLWKQTMDVALEEGAQLFVEVGPGRVLSGLARRYVSSRAEVEYADGRIRELFKLFQA